jgi:CBS domain-containing protein
VFVRDVMTTKVVSVAPEATLKQAVQLLAEHDITAMPVLDERGELVGVLSEADVLLDSFLPDPRAHETPVHLRGGPALVRVVEVMSRHVLTVPAGADLAEAADLMVSTVAKSLPVVEDNRVVGMLSRRDLIAVLARRDDVIAAAVDDLVRTSGHDWVTEVADGVVTVEGPEEAADVDLAAVLVATVPGVVGVRFPRQRSGR